MNNIDFVLTSHQQHANRRSEYENMNHRVIEKIETLKEYNDYFNAVSIMDIVILF